MTNVSVTAERIRQTWRQQSGQRTQGQPSSGCQPENRHLPAQPATFHSPCHCGCPTISIACVADAACRYRGALSPLPARRQQPCRPVPTDRAIPPSLPDRDSLPADDQRRPSARSRRQQAPQAKKAARGGRINKEPLARNAARGSGTIFGSGLLSHMTLCSIIGDGELNFRVRNGVGCTLSSMATKEILSKYNYTGGRSFSRKQDARAISTGQLHTSRYFHLQPINEVVDLGPSGLASGRTYLKAGFPLRCFQRLSLPHIATLLCRWHDNRSTSGVSIPVLSY